MTDAAELRRLAEAAIAEIKYQATIRADRNASQGEARAMPIDPRDVLALLAERDALVRVAEALEAVQKDVKPHDRADEDPCCDDWRRAHDRLWNEVWSALAAWRAIQEKPDAE